ncbi:MAG: metallophosphoesterase [Phycisphaerae bacterium]|nr:metallophosphoesterase [Gemmatimonadaceae bacterium]
MRTVVQISDLHFGAILEPTLEPLVRYLHELRPDLTIVSGDLTQRARPSQFAEAKAYLKRLPVPQLVIPGNHDVPLYDILRRFAAPFARYDQYISPEHNPHFIDDEIAVVGINSAHSFTFKGGKLGEEAVRNAARRLSGLRGQVRIVVTHHPFDIPVGLSGVTIVEGAEHAVRVFAGCDVDLFLTGHLHLVHHAPASVFVKDYHAQMLVSGTAVSTRARGEPNSFYVFRIDHMQNDDKCLGVETHSWNAARNCFELTATRSAPRTSRARAAE